MDGRLKYRLVNRHIYYYSLPLIIDPGEPSEPFSRWNERSGLHKVSSSSLSSKSQNRGVNIPLAFSQLQSRLHLSATLEVSAVFLEFAGFEPSL
jgi:hypothetical protein